MSDEATVGVVIVGTITVRPEARPGFDTLIAELAVRTREEPGCRGFSFGPDAGDPTAVLVQEEYDDQQALATHQQQPYVAAYAQALPSLLAAPVTFRIYDIAGFTPLHPRPRNGIRSVLMSHQRGRGPDAPGGLTAPRYERDLGASRDRTLHQGRCRAPGRAGVPGRRGVR